MTVPATVSMRDVQHAIDILGIERRDNIQTTITPRSIRVERLVRSNNGRIALGPDETPRVNVEVYQVVND